MVSPGADAESAEFVTLASTRVLWVKLAPQNRRSVRLPDGRRMRFERGTMSVTLEEARKLGRKRADKDPAGARLFCWLVTVAVSPLVVLFFVGWSESHSDVSLMASLALVVVLADLLPVPHWNTTFNVSVSTPIIIAAGMMLNPVEAGAIAWLAAFDRREFTGEVPLARAAFNRSQVAASAFLGSAVFHSFGQSPTDFPVVLGPLVLAVLADFAVNTLLVITAAHYLLHLDRKEIFKNVYGDAPARLAGTYAFLGLLAIFVPTEVKVAGSWGVLAFIVPLLLARELFNSGEQLRVAARQIRKKNVALIETVERIAAERRDERLSVAGELHDEVLPPLFKVHLMGQVLRQDLISGRLLELDDDIPELLTATELAQEAIRSLVGDLRRSSLGPAGLNSTLKLLAQQLEAAGSPNIVLELEDVGGSDAIQLLAYQIFREAMTNASRYSKATSLKISVRKGEGGSLHLLVEDDGVGFDPARVESANHFGLQLIRERAEAAGGIVHIDSLLGGGTRVRAVLPPDLPSPS
jgi:signal transduction histidine kinase